MSSLKIATHSMLLLAPKGCNSYISCFLNFWQELLSLHMQLKVNSEKFRREENYSVLPIPELSMSVLRIRKLLASHTIKESTHQIDFIFQWLLSRIRIYQRFGPTCRFTVLLMLGRRYETRLRAKYTITPSCNRSRVSL